jgi:predicted DNA-binding transcriptional regulator YafY
MERTYDEMRTVPVLDLRENAVMTSTTRLLRLLALMPARPVWSGADLAERLEVTPRTVRRDVARLRDLGYPVQAEPGPAGGYRWLRGDALPPLLLDDDEAVAVVLALRAAAGGGAPVLDGAAVTAMAKLQQVLPSGLAARVREIDDATVRLPGPSLDTIGTDVLMVLAQACRRRTSVRIDYATASGTRIAREVEPLRVVHAGRRWYLVAHDVERADWRTYRLDRIERATSTERVFRHVDPPDPLELVARGTSRGPYRLQVQVRVEATPDQVRAVVPRTVAEVLPDPEHPASCLLELGASGPEWVIGYLGMLPFDWELLSPPEVRRVLVERAEAQAARHRERGGPG